MLPINHVLRRIRQLGPFAYAQASIHLLLLAGLWPPLKLTRVQLP